MRKLAVVSLLLALLVASISPAFAQEEEPGTIADVVTASASAAEGPEFTTLLTAISLADPAVLEALSDPEASLTVFAPTDAAFAAAMEAMPEELSAALADPALLTAILTYHVVEGAAASDDVVALLDENEDFFTVETLNGQYLDISRDEDGVIYIDDSVLTVTDIQASNGVIHVIDAVLVPETRTIAEIVVEAAGAGEMAEGEMEEEVAPEFTALLAAVSAADPAILEALSNPEASLTVFAPTDAAFAALGEETLNAVLADQAMLTAILQYHVVDGAAYSGDLAEMMGEEMADIEVTMLDGNVATITVDEEGNAFINEAQIILTDIDAANGVIHVIDAVILPPAAE